MLDSTIASDFDSKNVHLVVNPMHGIYNFIYNYTIANFVYKSKSHLSATRNACYQNAAAAGGLCTLCPSPSPL